MRKLGGQLTEKRRRGPRHHGRHGQPSGEPTPAAVLENVSGCLQTDYLFVTQRKQRPRRGCAIAAVLHGWRSPTAFQTGVPELDDLRARLTGRPILCARASMPYGPPDETTNNPSALSYLTTGQCEAINAGLRQVRPDLYKPLHRSGRRRYS
jgi:hypothetical protein